MALTPPPPAPSRALDAAAVFSTKADALVAWYATNVTELGLLQTDVAAKQALATQAVIDATAQVGLATAQVGLATTQANNAATSAGNAAASAASALNAPGTNATSVTTMTPGTGAQAFTLAQTGKTFVVGQWVTISDTAAPGVNFAVGPIAAFTPGTGAITVNRTFGTGVASSSWSVVAASTPGIPGALPVTVQAGTTQTAAAGNHYVMTNSGDSTLTLPATPAANDEVWVTFTNGKYANNVARNGNTIYGAALDFLINAGVLLTWKFKYLNGDWKTT